jgi:diaminopimelate epimerase
MQGSGNDFVVIDATRQPLRLEAETIRKLAHRHFGVGFDQLLVIEPARTRGTDFYYRIFNADGGEVNQCGNGARCFVRYVHDKGLSGKSAIRVETGSGVIEPRLEKDGRVTVAMGAPESIEIGAVSMGNPHAVQVVADVEAAPVLTEGPLIEKHPRFPQRANAGYMQIDDRRRIRLRVFERGSGETLACGTGACAAVAVGIARGLLDSPVEVQTHGGKLEIAWQGEGHAVLMTGPAATVYEGEIIL